MQHEEPLSNALLYYVGPSARRTGGWVSRGSLYIAQNRELEHFFIFDSQLLHLAGT